jgi:8-oxo-dGTP diphosphatase
MLRQDKIVRAGVAFIVMRFQTQDIDDLQILLLKRAGSHGAGTWSVPGGWIDFGEESSAAAVRECLEETGLRATHIKPCGVTEDFFEADGKHCVTLWHRGIVPPGSEPQFTEPDKVTEFRWVAPGDRLPEPLFLPLKHFLEDNVL